MNLTKYYLNNIIFLLQVFLLLLTYFRHIIFNLYHDKCNEVLFQNTILFQCIFNLFVSFITLKYKIKEPENQLNELFASNVLIIMVMISLLVESYIIYMIDHVINSDLCLPIVNKIFSIQILDMIVNTALLLCNFLYIDFYIYLRKHHLYKSLNSNQIPLTFMCIICLEDTRNKVVKLKCNHVFHLDCIMKWELTLKHQDITFYCPYCRS